MNAIYGPKGVKAGFTSEESVADVDAAIDELVGQGVEVIVLGCTELPILLSEPERVTGKGSRVTLVDPTDILAKRCVSAAMMWSRR
jgi:aspartate racemase